MVEKDDSERKNLINSEALFVCYDQMDEESQMKNIHGCFWSWGKFSIFCFLSLTIVPLLLVKWSNKIRRWFLYTYCPLSEATHVAVESRDGNAFDLIELNLLTINFPSPHEVIVMCYRFFPYYYEKENNTFLPIKYDCAVSGKKIHEEKSMGISTTEHYQDAHSLYGDCNIIIPDKGLLRVFIDEILSPFYVFQIFSFVVWILDDYYYYCCALIIITSISIIIEIVNIRTNEANIRNMAMFERQISVFRRDPDNKIKDTKFQTMGSSNLVPGDIIEIPEAGKLPCDVVLLSGNVVLSESMLTGESIPVIKTPIPDSEAVYDVEADKKCTLYAGTEVIQIRSVGNIKPVGLVVRTGFTTSKGALVRSILYPKSSKFSFDTDAYKFIAMMFALSIIGLAARLSGGIQDEAGEFALRILDLITITVPPALPACMSIGTAFALSRLKKKKIFCISPPKINAAGKIQLFCFDKTGTLTEEGQLFCEKDIDSVIKKKQQTFFEDGINQYFH